VVPKAPAAAAVTIAFRITHWSQVAQPSRGTFGKLRGFGDAGALGAACANVLTSTDGRCVALDDESQADVPALVVTRTATV
jgi:hypothetical protein